MYKSIAYTTKMSCRMVIAHLTEGVYNGCMDTPETTLIREKLDALDSKLDRLISVVVTKEEIRPIENRMQDVAYNLERLVTAVDGLVKGYDDLRIEYVAIKSQLSRYERWFEELAKKTGVKLEY
jgi:argininosuccinate synthase